MDIQELIQYGLDEAGCPNLQVIYEWNNRFTRRLGDASYGKIRLSSKLWPTMSEAQKIDTVLHELAHVIDIYQNGRMMEDGGHGYTWKQIAKKIGAKPERYASSDAANFAKFRRRTTRHSVQCNCMTHEVTTYKYNKMKKGVMYRCRNCGHLLKIWRVVDRV